MLYLAYTFEPTAHARAHLEEFWEWMQARVPWFYRDLTMVLAISWRCETRSDGQPLIHHEVAFADEAAMAEYRAALAERGRNQAWERRRRDQDRWYRIVARSIQHSPPVSMALPHHAEPAPAPAGAL